MNDKDTKIFSYLKLKFLIPLRKPPVESFFVRIEVYRNMKFLLELELLSFTAMRKFNAKFPFLRIWWTYIEDSVADQIPD